MCGWRVRGADSDNPTGGCRVRDGLQWTVPLRAAQLISYNFTCFGKIVDYKRMMTESVIALQSQRTISI